MPPSCSVPTCKLLNNSPPKLSYHEIPSKEPVRAIWLRQIGISMGQPLWQPSSETAVVCSKHFIESDFVETPQRRRLRPNAVPSVFYVIQGKPYLIPHRRRRSKFSSTAPNPFANLQNENVSIEENQVNGNMFENSEAMDEKYEQLLQAHLDKAFLEMLQVNLEMMDVANHFLADCSSQE